MSIRNKRLIVYNNLKNARENSIYGRTCDGEEIVFPLPLLERHAVEISTDLLYIRQKNLNYLEEPTKLGAW